MEKKVFPKKEKDSGHRFFNKLKVPDMPGGDSPSKVPGLSNKAFAFVKFVLGICILPFVYAITVSFLAEFQMVEPSLRINFWSGVISFLIVYLFIFEPAKVYQKGQQVLEVVFHFFAPLVKMAPYVLPIYTIIIFFLYLVVSFFIKSNELISYFMFCFGLSIALHLVFSAKSLRLKQDFLKANYLFGFSLVYIINLLLAGLFLNLLFEKFSFVNFFNNAFLSARILFGAVFKQLFGV